MSKFLIPLAFFLGSAGIAMFYVIPQWQHYLAIRVDDKHLQEISEEIDRLTTKRDDLVDKINRIPKEDFQRMDQIIPTNAHAPEFLLSLEQAAVLHNLTVKRLDLGQDIKTQPKTPAIRQSGFVPPESIENKQPYKDFLVNMDVSGSYESFKDFLRDIEVFARITDAKTVVLKENSELHDFKFTLTLTTYYQ